MLGPTPTDFILKSQEFINVQIHPRKFIQSFIILKAYIFSHTIFQDPNIYIKQLLVNYIINIHYNFQELFYKVQVSSSWPHAPTSDDKS